jgi:hypothetical protein
MVTNAINNDDGIEKLRSFTFLYFKADDNYIFELPDIENFFHILEDYNTYDESFGDVNQKFTLIRLRDALIRSKVWDEELLIAAVRFDRIQSLELQKTEGKLGEDQFRNELKKYCYEHSNLYKVMGYYNSLKI